MMTESIAAIEATLGLAQEPLLLSLWQERRLKVSRPLVVPDAIDRLTASLLITARRHRHPTLAVLPDGRPHRAAVLLAVNLLAYWADERKRLIHEPKARLRPVLYLGAHGGIHDQLARIHVRGLPLEEVFARRKLAYGHLDLGRAIGIGSEALPELVTSVAPADPAALINHIQPGLVAIDLADVPRSQWVAGALAAAANKGVAVMGWGINPLSEGAQAFANHGFRFVWPIGAGHLEVQPVVLSGETSQALAELLATARRALVAAAPLVDGPLGKSALRAHWGRLRALESLSVPFALHEAEAGRPWGLRSMAHWRSLGDRFREACVSDRTLTVALAEAARALDEGEALLALTSPPLWQALVELCIDEPPTDEVRLLIFPSSARLELFLLGLLAYYNVTVDDLRSLRVWAVTPTDLRRMRRQHDLAIERGRVMCDVGTPDPMSLRHLHLAGLPSVSDAPALGVLLGEQHFEVLVYPHQQSALFARIGEWNQAADWSTGGHAQILAGITGGSRIAPTLATPPSITVRPANNHVLQNKEETGFSKPRPKRWPDLDPTAEVAAILEVTAFEANEGSVFRDMPTFGLSIVEQAWCDTAICLSLSAGWMIRCAPDMTVQVVVKTGRSVRTEERFVRSVRLGDQLMLIHGQRRQNLYEMLVNKIHQHPAMLLHVTLIERWRMEAARAYARRHANDGLTLEGLLEALRRRGSRIATAQAIGFWLRGETLAPSDPEDLVRLSDELRAPFLRDQCYHITRAASRLRGLHRGLANRLNHWLGLRLREGDMANDDEVFDAELGLSLNDFKDALLVVLVEHVNVETGPFLYDDLGQPERRSGV